MFATSLFTYALLATGALAIPSGSERLAARVARRTGLRQLGSSEFSHATNKSDVSFSTNWSGAVLSKAAGTFKSVTGTFTVPTPKRSSSGGSGTQSSSAWVGIDGDTCQTAILQTGLDFSVSSSGAVSYDAWYEWFPDFAHDFTGISFSPGDSVKVTVTATSTRAGTAVIQNVSKGQTVTKSLTSRTRSASRTRSGSSRTSNPAASSSRSPTSAPSSFTGASAGMSSGSTGPSGATLIDMESSSGRVLTSATSSSNSVTVSYTAS